MKGGVLGVKVKPHLSGTLRFVLTIYPFNELVGFGKF